MAKGLRSKSKGRFRAIRREEVFQTTIDERTERLAKLQADAANKTKVSNSGDEEMGAEALTEEMKTDEEHKKVSTSGPRSKKHGRKLEKKKAAKKAKQGKGLAIFSK
ncbi:hypothetical protein Unana1_06357 [Umbelopsis nana]